MSDGREHALAGAQILHTLCGPWKLIRDVQPLGAQLRGTGVFTPAGEDVLAYREDGTLKLPDGRQFSAYRRYFYRARADCIAVEFADGSEVGKLFLRLCFSRTDGGLEANGIHNCGKDTYHATYRILGSAVFETVFRVTGPQKASELQSRYTRLA